jgi:hypothetical protein
MIKETNKNEFNLEQARKDGNLARALIWLGPNKFKWCRVRLMSPQNQFGQYQVQRVSNGWYATTDRLMNLREQDRGLSPRV